MPLYDSRAIRAEHWPLLEAFWEDGWQVRNQLTANAGEPDTDQRFWSLSSSDGDPDIRLGVIYIRRLYSEPPDDAL